ncbi:MAG TPA: hypothetical protein VN285_02175 [Candidatus Deferrimicrobium sp.]|nr:hypothetical protein [Candidatus Deferrimicrobium sp.]
MYSFATFVKPVLPKLEDGYMSRVQSETTLLRKNLDAYGLQLPAPLGLALNAHVHERRERCEGRPMMGECAPFLIGPLFSITGSAVRSVAYPWLLMYEYSLLLDDLVDTARSNRSNETILSQVLLATSVSEFRNVVGDEVSIWNAYATYRDEWLNAMLHEVNSPADGTDQFSEDAILQHGKKAAIVKFCAACMVFLDKGRLLTVREEQAIDCFCSGVQMLDDVADITEDFLDHRDSILLGDIYDWIQKHCSYCDNNSTGSQSSCLVAGLVYSGAVSRAWRTAADCFDTALGLLNGCENEVSFFFVNLARRCRHEAQLLDVDIKALPPLDPPFICEYIGEEYSARRFLDSSRVPESWRRILERIKTGPKASQ